MDLVLPLLFKFFISLCTLKQLKCDLSSRMEETPLLRRTYVLCRALSDPEIDDSWENTVKHQDGQFATRASPGEQGIFKKLPLSRNRDHFL